MRLTPYKLGEFCRMKYGKMPPKGVLSEEGFPVSSHSDTFRELYHPCYRVVSLDALAEQAP